MLQSADSCQFNFIFSAGYASDLPTGSERLYPTRIMVGVIHTIKLWVRKEGGWLVGFQLLDASNRDLLKTDYRHKDYPTDSLETTLQPNERIVGFKARQHHSNHAFLDQF